MDDIRLLCKTRGSSNPQGKPRVYFTGYPADIQLYLDELTDDILRISNCAIYYESDAEKNPSQEELDTFYANMQLFVMPITSRFLYKENAAREVFFEFAMEKHIPVLPIMMEKNLEEDFNSICGELQFLDKCAKKDPTVEPYEKKLEAYLNSVLVGDELAGKIRSAFDAYIFLSYRKKDRKEAQELMRQIHQKDTMRDIAIWYDENLVPGENFTDAIRDAMKKSELFTMAVTPNLLEKDNYVMKEEYPNARNMNKSVLPAEMLPTDKNKLKESFENLPDVVDGKNGDALNRAIEEKLNRITNKENDKDPEHMYLMGLAYLKGIDVEIDSEYGLKMIKLSAEAGFLQAITRLVSLYWIGEGTERNREEAIVWQERLCSTLEKSYINEPTEEKWRKLFYEIWKLGDCLVELEKYDEGKEAYETMVKLCENEEINWDVRESKSVSLDRMGEIANKTGSLREANNYFTESLILRKELAKNSESTEALRGLYVSLMNKGDVEKKKGRLDEAEKYYQQSLDIVGKQAEEFNKIEDLIGASAVLERIGSIAEEKESLEEAEHYYLLSLEIDTHVVIERGTTDDARALSVSRLKMANIETKMKRFKEADEYFADYLEIAEKLKEVSGKAEDCQNLAFNLVNMGRLNKENKDYLKAESYLIRGIELYQKLSRTKDVLLGLYLGLNYLGDIAIARGNLLVAEGFFANCLKILDELVQEREMWDIRCDQSIILYKMGEIAKAKGNFQKAEEYYRLSKEIAENSPA